VGNAQRSFVDSPSGAATVAYIAAQLNDLLSRAKLRHYRLRSQLKYGLVHLGLDSILQKHFAVCQNHLKVRAQLTRLRIDDLKFLLDSERDFGSRSSTRMWIFVASFAHDRSCTVWPLQVQLLRIRR